MESPSQSGAELQEVLQWKIERGFGATLEELSVSFEGVQQAFAIQAGREVRVIVKPENIDDLASARLARDIAKKIEETMQYPGQIKVTVIRETRSTEFAK